MLTAAEKLVSVRGLRSMPITADNIFRQINQVVVMGQWSVPEAVTTGLIVAAAQRVTPKFDIVRLVQGR